MWAHLGPTIARCGALVTVRRGTLYERRGTMNKKTLKAYEDLIEALAPSDGVYEPMVPGVTGKKWRSWRARGPRTRRRGDAP